MGGSILMGSAFDNGISSKAGRPVLGLCSVMVTVFRKQRWRRCRKKPLTVALRGSGPVQRGLHVGGSQHGAIGEGDAGAQGEGINPRVASVYSFHKDRLPAPVEGFRRNIPS